MKNLLSFLLFTICLSLLKPTCVFANPLEVVDNPQDTEQNYFGSSVAIDGYHMLISSQGSFNGPNQVHLFDVESNNHIYTFNDPIETSLDTFGSSIALDGNRVLIGDALSGYSGNVHLFDITSGDLLRTFNDPSPGESLEGFGYSVALDGNHVLIGQPGDSTNGTASGQANLFDVATGNLIHTFNNPVLRRHESFGNAVALDGDYVLIGARGHLNNRSTVGQSHLFDTSSGNLIHTFDEPTASGNDFFGTSVALDSNHVLISSPYSGANGEVHLFSAISGDLIRTFESLSPGRIDKFGTSIAIEGNHVLVGSVFLNEYDNEVGKTQLFEITTGLLRNTYDNPSSYKTNGFGNSIALDNNLLLIGAASDRRNVGQAYLYDISIPEPSGLLLVLLGVNSLPKKRERNSLLSWR